MTWCSMLRRWSAWGVGHTVAASLALIHSDSRRSLASVRAPAPANVRLIRSRNRAAKVCLSVEEEIRPPRCWLLILLKRVAPLRMPLGYRVAPAWPV